MTLPEDLGGYHATTPWNGLDRWQCNDCPHASLDPTEMADHVRKHNQPPADTHTTSPILGPTGNPIITDRLDLLASLPVLADGDIADLNRDQLLDLAARRHIETPSKARKSDIAAAILDSHLNPQEP